MWAISGQSWAQGRRGPVQTQSRSPSVSVSVLIPEWIVLAAFRAACAEFGTPAAP